MNVNPRIDSWSISRVSHSELIGSYSWISPSGKACSAVGKIDELGLRCFEDDGNSFVAIDSCKGAEAAQCAAWSPGGRFIVTGSGNHERALRLFDLRQRHFLTMFGRHHDDLYSLSWSRSGSYIASASQHHHPQLKLWKVDYLDASPQDAAERGQEVLFSFDDLGSRPAISVNLVKEISHICNHPYNPQGLDGLYGFHSTDISRDDSLLTTVASLKGKGQRIVILSVPDLRELYQFEIEQRVEDIKWCHDQQSLLFRTSDYKVYTFGPIEAYSSFSPIAEELAVGPTDISLPHPRLPICALSSGRFWMLNQAPSKGRISIFNLVSGRTISELEPGSPVIDMSWSRDGSYLHALCANATRIRYEF